MFLYNNKFKNILTKFQKKRYENYIKINEYYNNLSKEELKCEYINLKASYKFKTISFFLTTPLFLFALYKLIGVMFIYSQFFPKIDIIEISPDMIKLAIFSSICLIISSTLVIFLIIKVILNILRCYYQNILILENIIKEKKAS